MTEISTGPWRLEQENIDSGVPGDDPIGCTKIYDKNGKIIMCHIDGFYYGDMEEANARIMAAGYEMFVNNIAAALCLSYSLTSEKLGSEIKATIAKVLG